MMEGSSNLDPRISKLKDLHLEIKTIRITSIQEGEFEGEWTARSVKKKFKRRKITVEFDNKLSYTPSDIIFYDVEYQGTTGLKLINKTKSKFVCLLYSNDTGKSAKIKFKWKTQM